MVSGQCQKCGHARDEHLGLKWFKGEKDGHRQTFHEERGQCSIPGCTCTLFELFTPDELAVLTSAAEFLESV